MSETVVCLWFRGPIGAECLQGEAGEAMVLVGKPPALPNSSTLGLAEWIVKYLDKYSLMSGF